MLTKLNSLLAILLLSCMSVYAAAQEMLLHGVTLRAVSFPSAEVGYAVGYNGTIVKSEDGGKTWHQMPITYRKSFLTMHFFDNNNGIIGGDNQFMAYTQDGGKTWNKAKCDCQIPTAAFMDMHFYDSKRGIATGGQGLVAITEDGGRSWQQIKVNSRPALFFAQYLDKKKIFIVSDRDVYISENAGKSFEQIKESNIHHRIMCGKFYNDKIGFVASTDGNLYKTTDGGQRWTYRALGDKRTKFRSINFKDKHIYLTGNFSGVIASHDGGKNWDTHFLDLGGAGKTLFGVAITTEAVVVVGEDGYIYRSTDNGMTWHNVSYFL